MGWISISTTRYDGAAWLVVFEPDIGAPTSAAFVDLESARSFAIQVVNDHDGGDRTEISWRIHGDVHYASV